jgi:hypothetical protein
MDALLVMVGVVLGVILWHVLLPLVASYAQAKGKNLADKEDIARITRLVEDVKQENQLILEQVRMRQQLRLAAADKRLLAHQQAFAMWRGLVQTVHTPQIAEIVRTCQIWWENNCLYLTADARGAFMQAYTAASGQRSILDGPRNPETRREAQANWAVIMAAGIRIVEGVNLPALGEAEATDVTNPPTQAQNTSVLPS